MGNTRITTQTPTNPTSNKASTSQTQLITSLHPDTQIVDEAFMIANYSQLEPLMKRMMRDLRLQGVATRLVYSSEDVDVEMKMEAPLRFLGNRSLFTWCIISSKKEYISRHGNFHVLSITSEVEAFDFKALEVEAFEPEAFEAFDIEAFKDFDFETFEDFDFKVKAFDFEGAIGSSSLYESVYRKGYHQLS
ncbi:hypothetical protein Tco_1131162 [Tanacetum coccineum]